MSFKQFTRRLRLIMLPLAISCGIIGFFLFHYVSWLAPLKPAVKQITSGGVPWLIFIMLFIAFCKVEISKMKPKWWHFLLTAFQVLSSLGLALAVHFDPEMMLRPEAEGLLACLICPTAAAAAVITGKLGGSESALTTYTIFSNLAAAVAIPLIFPLVSEQVQLDFISEFLLILGKVFPLIVLPLILALIVRYTLKPLHRFIIKYCGDLGFYLWGLTLTIVSAQAMSNLVNSKESAVTLWLLCAVGLVATVLQFGLGKLMGHLEGQRISAGQGLGQKNMVFGIWVTFTYLSPAAAIAPGCYILWQNIVNAFQLWYKDRFDQKRSALGLPPYRED